MAYKTPGVYVKEVSIFPPSVAEVETAIPAFIGYTQKAEKRGGDLTNVPTRISSLLEYNELFGGVYDIARVNVVLNASNNYAVDSAKPTKRFYMYESLRLFFDNGGGPCYIVSVGSYSDAVINGNSTATPPTSGLSVGLKKLEKYDEPTIILYPDAPLLASAASFYSLQQRTLSQCATLQDRVALFDLRESATRDLNDTVVEFRNNIGINNLKYGAAYTPWLHSAYPKTISFTVFKDYVTKKSDSSTVDLGKITADSALNALVTSAESAITDQATIDSKVIALRGGEKTLKDQFAKLRNAVVNTNDAGADVALIALLGFVQSVAVDITVWKTALKGENLLLDLNAYAKDKLKEAIHDLIQLEKNDDVQSQSGTSDGDINTNYILYDATTWLDEYDTSTPADGTAVEDIAGSTSDYNNSVAGPTLGDHATALNIITGKDGAGSSAKGLDAIFDSINNFVQDVITAADTHAELTQNTLYEKHSIIGNIVEHIKREYSKVPPSGAIAGLYAFVDNARGVWKAPANVSVNSVRGPVEAIDAAEQEDLNVDVTGGKSINAIRTFTGRGTIVWGARTLAGNDNEWRYIPVRRFYNMVEESVKKSTAWAVFEPNTAQLWTKVKGMIENYLVQKWREGALAGSTPEEAFFVKIGLGQTMTAQDILEGRLIVEIGMAAVRPAEFIVLKFMHKLQES